MIGKLNRRPFFEKEAYGMNQKSRWYGIVATLVAFVLAFAPVQIALAGHLTGTPATYTLNADFDEGTLVNVNHDVADQLQLNSVAKPFAFIWVAVSTKGTVVKIDVNTGVVLGEYRTAPNGRALDPSRTTVDSNGNVWATNRAESGLVAANAIALGLPPADGRMGSVVHIGLEENGQCVDRNLNGVIDTSTGLDDILPWINGSGVNDLGGVSTAEDECIIHYTRVNAYGARHVSVNTANNVWVSGTGDRTFDLIDGATGGIIRQEPSVGFGGYGGLIDGAGVIWSAGPLLRWDTANPLTGLNGDPGGFDIGPPVAANWSGQYSPDSYGLCINPVNGEVWNTELTGGLIHRYAPNGRHIGSFAHGNSYAQGCVVDSNGHVWVAHSILGPQTTVGHLNAAGVHLGNVAVGSGPTGVAVDADGRVWATNYSSRTVSRIDPALAGGVGAVDLTTVDLGGNLYNYSDMTGSTLIAPPNNGAWTIVQDSGVAGQEWGKVSWTASTPSDSSLTVTAASSEDGITFGPPETATNGGDLSVANGQYLKVTVSFTRATTSESPVLYDLTLSTNEDPDCSLATASPAQLWPPNHKYVTVVVGGVTDPDGDPVTITATAIFQDEAVNTNGVGAGNTSPDATLSPLAVRAERNGNPKSPGNGRVYHITFMAEDGMGGVCNGTVQVCVPHDQRPGSTCVDGGPLYDSLVP